MAAFSHSFVSAATPTLSRSVRKISLSKSLPYRRNPSVLDSVVSALRKNTICKSNSLASESDENSTINNVLDSFLVVCASAALSLALFVADVDRASAFVVTPPRKLQSDELATVRLFQENTPSVVYITNLAAKQDAFTLDIFEVPQGSGSGFIWDKDGHIVTNYHVIRGASDLRLGAFISLHINFPVSCEQAKQPMGFTSKLLQ